jgi:indolepyruvate ferredoxin oxidoreductase
LSGDPRFQKTSGIEAFTGNELLLKGALEAGVGLITGYPGSPVSDIFDVISSEAPFLIEQGVVAQIANNEGLATARLNGARQAGLRALAIMKSVGLHVGADALAVGNLMEIRKRDGGAVVVVGDDPWNETTQINSDSRFLSRHLHMPVLEPSTFQEVKDWIAAAFDLSGISDLYITYILTTNQADGGGTVTVRPHRPMPVSNVNPTTLSSKNIVVTDTVLLPPQVSAREATLSDRMLRLQKRARELGLNQWHGPRRVRMPVGFVAAGLSYAYLEQTLKLLGLWSRTPILKLGVTYPVDPDDILELASHVEHLVVVEEKRGFLEEQIAHILTQWKQAGRLEKIPALWGKRFPNEEPGFPENRGLNVSVMLDVLGPAFLRWKEYFPTLNVDRINKELAEIVHTRSSSFDVPTRTPTFCPGCPHRDSSTVSLELKKKFIEKGSDVVFHGEAGCHSMLQYAPNEGLMQSYSGMGLGGGTGAGMDPFVTNKQVVFLGDSTFFHSGIVAVSDSIKNNQNITYIILENKTTAMTGHQPTPGNDVDVMGKPTFAQDIENTLRGLAPQGIFIARVNPADREKYQPFLEETVARPGVKVIIADKECAITLYRRKNAEKKIILKQQGYIAHEEKINITPEVCEYCLECTRQTACPGLTVEETAHGRKIATDRSTCVDDGACARTKACPSFERLIIERSQPAVAADRVSLNWDDVPAATPASFDHKWSAYTAGVGGMGAGVVNAVLVRAGMTEKYEVGFLDKKGLAIRNGGVYGHIVFSKDEHISTPVIPYGKADLLVGLDALEAARALDARTNLRVAHPARTHAVVNTHKNETVLSLMGRQDFDPGTLENVIRAKVRLGGYVSADFSELSENYLGSKLYANMMILGAAYQKGWLPLSEASLLDAIAQSVRASDVEVNQRAFRIGRYVSAHPDMLHPEHVGETAASLVEKNASRLQQRRRFGGPRQAALYRERMKQAMRWMDTSPETTAFMARAVYDLIRYGGIKLADRYLELVWTTYRKDQKKFDFRATRAVVQGLYRTLAIKDEVWVAELLTSPEKYERDQKRYNLDASRGDRVKYLHYNRPRFQIGPWAIEFDVLTRDWMLRIMARFGILRRLLPMWHADEKKFQRWYVHMVERFTFFESAQDYESYAQALEVHDKARGYREIRAPRMEAAMKEADALLAQIGKTQQEKIFSPS